ncbi:DUF5710 domain-containing protein (plasmid) [Agrobacterium sp. rho-13.3]|uniref:DUF5710 domain-containing protein n=1 Tax=Agrobacterium sp. rho-13.3 TaxID=3072980 RepID=UPI002A141E33|nr:DUF5710 domain-containing protein [Agrobacterium sp. rho-13.3]MDX8311539.1 DUF5710 domain-containing protein [Agrobacterium sp. rho-13.3]
MDGKTYLAVPYEERDAAKALGARWDTAARAWFAPAGTALDAGLERWLPKEIGAGRSSGERPADHVIAQDFGKMLRECGALFDGDPVMDGKRHRVRVVGDKPYQKSGQYKGYLDHRPAGSFTNFKEQEATKWTWEGGDRATTSPEERAAHNAKIELERQRRESEELAKHEAAGEIARAVYGLSQRATPSNAYCRAKGITNPGGEGLRIVPASLGDELAKLGVTVASDVRAAKEIRKETPGATIFIKGDLLVPAYDLTGKLWTVQSVNTQFKSFMRGGRKMGLHAMAGCNGPFHTSVLASNPALPIVICEGRATGDALARALGHPVVVAFDAGNIRNVAAALREAHPGRTMVIAGDNDHAKAMELLPNGRLRGNPGMEQATATAKALGLAAAFPSFAQGDNGSDWNDVAKADGLPKMRLQLTNAISAATAALEAKAAQLDAGTAVVRHQAEREPRKTAQRSAEAEPERHAGIRYPTTNRPTSREMSHDR